MTLIFASFFFTYLCLVAFLIRGWNKCISKKPPTPRDNEFLLSVIIPVRNEGRVICNLLEDISDQSYKNFEVVIVNDHSTDDTKERVGDFVDRDNRFKLLHACDPGKKSALTLGIGSCKGEIVVTTDGDCRVGKNWLISLAQYFEHEHCKMVFGGVKIDDKSFFAKIQANEFLSLVGTAAATLTLGYPTMCNGANLAFRKSIFAEVGGYVDNLHIPSGDDEFLMHKIFARYPHGVLFSSDIKSIVTTSPAESIRQLIHQRIRWAGKWQYNRLLINTMLAIFVFGFQFAVVVLPIAIIMEWINPLHGVLFLVSKAVVELLFLTRISDFLNSRWRWIPFVLLQVIYPSYVVFIGLISNFAAFEWKGRKLKTLTVSAIKK